jgi:hypothetical protein
VAPGKDNALCTETAHEIVGNVVGMDLAINLCFAYPPRDELRVLGAEVEDEDLLVHPEPYSTR